MSKAHYVERRAECWAIQFLGINDITPILNAYNAIAYDLHVPEDEKDGTVLTVFKYGKAVATIKHKEFVVLADDWGSSSKVLTPEEFRAAWQGSE